MNTREVTFELSGEDEFPVTIEWNYSFTPGRYFDLPENCYPDEEESEVYLPSDLAEQVKRFAVDVMVPRWIKEIESAAGDMEWHGVRKWAEEAAND